MALFIVRHQHQAERCLAKDPYAGATLLNYLSRPSVRQLGVDIQGEAVAQGEHILYMIVESNDEDRVPVHETLVGRKVPWRNRDCRTFAD